MKYIYRQRGAPTQYGRPAEERSAYHYTDDNENSRCQEPIKVGENGYELIERNHVLPVLVCMNCKRVKP